MSPTAPEYSIVNKFLLPLAVPLLLLSADLRSAALSMHAQLALLLQAASYQHEAISRNTICSDTVQGLAPSSSLATMKTSS